MRIPDPKANTTTEAYLAYKAGYLEESELKPVLYEPYLHFDAWLAYWAGLTNTYPMKKSKNIFNSPDNASGVYRSTYEKVDSNSFIITSTSTTQGTVYAQIDVSLSPNTSYTISYNSMVVSGVPPSVAGSLAVKVGSAAVETPKKGERTFVTDGSGNVKFYFYLGVAESGGQITVGDAVKIYDIQLEQGREATDFEEYSNAPEMLCDEEALVAYLSGVTDTYPEEIKDPYDVRIVGYLKYLVSARWGRPEYPVNNEEFYLSTMKPPVVPSGDTPSSDIEMDDTAEAPFIDLKMYGDTSQNMYSGAQLFAKDGLATPASDTEFWETLSNATKTDLANGWAHLKGTSSSTTNANMFIKLLAGGPNVTPSTLYTIIVEVKDVVGTATIRLTSPGNQKDTWEAFSFDDIIYEETPHTSDAGTLGWDGLSQGFYVAKLTTKSSLARYIFRLWSHLNTSRELSLRISLLKGDHSSDWRDYCGENWQPYVGGGEPAPNPDYPQDVQVVTGEQEVRTTGKNLLRYTRTFPYTVHGITATLESDNSITLNGTMTTSSTHITIASPLDLSEYSNKPVTVSVRTSGVGAMSNAGVKKKNGSSTDLIVLSTFSGDTSKSSTGTINFNQYNNILFDLWFNNTLVGTTFENFNIKPQVEGGSTATAYEAYEEQKYLVGLCGKNMFNKAEALTYKWLTAGTGQLVSSDDPNVVTPYIKVEVGKKYTFSGIGDLQIRVFGYANLTDNKLVTYIDNLRDQRTFTAQYPYMRAAIGGGDAVAVIDAIQCEEGDTATSFEPYTHIELCKIGDYQDYIYRDEDGDWFVHKEIKKEIFDGTKEWKNFRVINDTYNSVEINPEIVSGRPEVFCPYFRWISQDNANAGSHIYTFYGGGGLKCYFQNTIANSLEEWHTWLSKKNMPIYYPWATPTNAQITNSELIAQLDALMEGGSYDGKTYIKVTATDPNLPGLLYVEAGKYD